MNVEIIREITKIETIAISSSIREVARLRKIYGSGCWRKLKEIARICLDDCTICEAEIH